MPAIESTALVTGATSGLGREVAKALSGAGRRVLVHGRDGRRAEELAAELRAGGGKAETYIADLASLGQVRDLAARVGADHARLDILVNNAGIGGGAPPRRKREVSADGYELRLAVNYLAPALLTRLLVPRLTAAAPARVVNVSSVGQAELDFNDVNFENNYDGAEAYFRSKFALTAFTFDLAKELNGAGVTVNCVHPATFMDTFQVQEAGVSPWTSASSGVPPVLNLAVGDPGAEFTGQYFEGTQQARAHRMTYQASVQEKLRRATDDLVEPFAGDGDAGLS